MAQTSSSFASRLSESVVVIKAAIAGGSLDALRDLSLALLQQNIPAQEIHTLFTIGVRSITNSFLASKPAPEDLVSVIRRYVLLALEASATKVVASAEGQNAPTVALVDATLPLLILEDAFDAASVSEAGALWQIIEDVRDSIAAIVNVQQRYRMPLLRICTSLMRRLSRSQHTVLLGRVLISLAYMFPLADRSGVNLLGLFNTDNTTAYEGDDEDVALVAAAVAATTPAPPPTGGSATIPAPVEGNPLALSPTIDAVLSAVCPSIACVPRLISSIATCRAALADVDKGQAATSQHFYRAFWRLQQFMSAPSKALATSEAWALFFCTLRLVLRAFEKEDTTAGGFTQLSVVLPPPPKAAAAPAAASAAGRVGATSAAPLSRVTAAAAAAAPEEGEEQDAPAPVVARKGAQPPASVAAPKAPTNAGPPPPPSSSSSSSSSSSLLHVPLAAFVKPLFAASENLMGFNAGPGLVAATALPNGIMAPTAAGPSGPVAATLTSSGSAASGLLASPAPQKPSSSHGASASSASEQASAPSASASYGVKYLSSPQLLKLELRDASLRRHILLQALILLQYIATQRQDAEAYAAAIAAVAAAQNAPAPPAAAGGATASGQSRAAALAAKQAATAAMASAVAAAQAHLASLRKPKESFAPSLLGASSSFSTDALFLTNMATHLLRRTSPDGLAFARSVTVVLQRESFWRAWKQASAPDFEKSLPPLPTRVTGTSASSEAAAGFEGSASGVGSKRKFGRLGGGPAAKRMRVIAKRPLGWASVGLEVDPWDTCADLSRVPKHSAEDYVQPMRTALDPGSGIETEYYPSNNRAYVWRAYRSLAAERVSAMADAASLPFIDLLCKMYNLTKPGSNEGGSGSSSGDVTEDATAQAQTEDTPTASAAVVPAASTDSATESAIVSAAAEAAEAPAAEPEAEHVAEQAVGDDEAVHDDAAGELEEVDGAEGQLPAASRAEEEEALDADGADAAEGDGVGADGEVGDEAQEAVPSEEVGAPQQEC